MGDARGDEPHGSHFRWLQLWVEYDHRVGIQEVIGAVLSAAEKLKASSAANEANTKALLIEPMLQSLGWTLADLDAVEREVKVFEGTFLDYALKVSSVPRVYVEAKGVGENLTDKKFVAQTVNYANNDGVIWCVLTNGLRYRVFKTNEPVAMDQKLLFEVDLTDSSEPASEQARLLRLLSRESVEGGDLTAFGDRVFTDTRVRRALSELASDPPAAFAQLLTERMGHPTVSPDALHRSLVRVLDGSVAPGAKAPTPLSPTKMPVGPAGPPKGQEYGLEHHLGNKSSLIRELWEAVDDYANSLGGDVSRRVRKQYIGYFRGKRSFFTTEIQKGRVLIYLALTPETAQPWNPEVMRDASNIGHFGMGDIEYSLVTVDQLDEARALIASAYGQ